MTETTAIWLVIGINCLIVLLVLGATYGLWIGSARLRRLSKQLGSVELNPQQLRYAIALQRLQLAKQRFGVATWQVRSRQVRQLIQLLQLLRTIALIQSGRRGLLPGRRVRPNRVRSNIGKR